MKLRSIILGAAAVSLAVAPVAAAANTRSSDSMVSLSAAQGATRMGSPVAGSEEAIGELPLFVLILLAAVLGITLTELLASPGIFD